MAVLVALVVAVLAVVIAGRAVSTRRRRPTDGDPHGAGDHRRDPARRRRRQIADILEHRGVIEDSSRFHDFANAQGQGSSFQAGTYSLQAGTGYDALIAQLDAGPAATPSS